MPKGYSRTQIILHWAIFLLIAFQYLNHEYIAETWKRLQAGEPTAFSPLVLSHVVAGLLVFALVLWRVALRLGRGAPALPAEEPAPLRLAARATHLGLYLLILLMPVTGALAWFRDLSAMAWLHETGRLALLALVLLHVCGALYQQFVLKTDVMGRMKRAG